MTDDVDSDIIHRELDTTEENPAAAVAELVADIEDKDHADLATMYECIDHVIDDLFSTPPASEAQVEVRFSYEGYRITIEQTGDVKLVKTGTKNT